MAAFGLTGCLTALTHGAAGATERTSTSGQQVAPNYYSTPIEKPLSPARSTAAVGSGSNAEGASAHFTASSAFNYYVDPAQTHSGAVSPQRYEAGAVTASPSRHSNQAYLHQQQAPVGYHAPAAQPVVEAHSQDYQRQSTASKRGVFSRVFNRNSSPVQSAPNAGLTILQSKLSGTTQTGAASWYGSKFHGGKTANGERYDMNSMTAAHRSLPFGTLVKVKNLNNNRECIVRVNNRGPFTKGRILDMSKAAAQELGFMGRGIAKVQMQVLGMHAK